MKALGLLTVKRNLNRKDFPKRCIAVAMSGRFHQGGNLDKGISVYRMTNRKHKNHVNVLISSMVRFNAFFDKEQRPFLAN